MHEVCSCVRGSTASSRLSCALQSEIKAGRLSSLQLESITYCLQRHQQVLPSGERAGFFIGDGAGMHYTIKHMVRTHEGSAHAHPCLDRVLCGAP